MFHMRSLTVLLAALAVSSGARAADEPSCQQTAGAAQSSAYVEQCLLVSADNNPACVASKPCAVIVGEIKQRCQSIKQSMQGRPATDESGEPAFCKAHLAN
jgi:hypothetical protein